MDNQSIRKWIEDNLVMQDEARSITEQSVSAFNQSVQTGRITPFVEFGKQRKTRLYLRSELEPYAKNKRKVGRTMKIYYEDILVGEVMTNRSMMVDEALESIGFDEAAFLEENGFDDIDYNDFRLEY